MKKVLGTALIAAMLTGTVATAQEIQPLDTTQSSQSLPVIGTIPPGAIVVLGFVILGGVIIGLASDGTTDGT